MARTGFEICNHTCGCIPPAKRPHPIEGCTIFQKEGSSCRRHAKSRRKHPRCTEQCPAHSIGGKLTREPTSQEWLKWAADLRQVYADRPDLLATIPLLPTESITGSSPNSRCSEPLGNKLSAVHEQQQHLPPNLRRKIWSG